MERNTTGRRYLKNRMQKETKDGVKEKNKKRIKKGCIKKE
jgi:hypothetical protein